MHPSKQTGIINISHSSTMAHSCHHDISSRHHSSNAAGVARLQSGFLDIRLQGGGGVLSTQPLTLSPIMLPSMVVSSGHHHNHKSSSLGKQVTLGNTAGLYSILGMHKLLHRQPGRAHIMIRIIINQVL